jgi:hypothetical protein
LDVITTEEEIADLPGGGFRSTGQIESHSQKSFEFTADMSPDKALGVANAIIQALGKFPPERKAVYGIPDNIAPIQPVTIGSAS